jgi:hypothetical protein
VFENALENPVLGAAAVKDVEGGLGQGSRMKTSSKIKIYF